MKLALQIAAGIVLALFILWCLSVALAVSPAAGGFFGVLLRDPGFWLLVVCLGLVIAGVVAIRRAVASRRP